MHDTARGALLLLAPPPIRNKLHRLALAGLVGTSVLAVASVAQAHITKITILSSAPAFGGYSFPGIGTYQVLKGYAVDAVDPNSPQNAVLTDIQLAPRDVNGKVEVIFNFYILKPTDITKGNGKMMYEPPNRGSKTFGVMNNTPSFPTVNDPASLINTTALQDSFLWTRGYTTVWSGWEYEGDPTSSGLAGSAAGVDANGAPLTSMPVAYGPGNTTLTGPGYEYIVQTATATTYTLSYPAASGDQSNAVLTHRVRLDDPPQVVPTTQWSYNDTNNQSIKLTGGFVPQDIYEFSYLAKNPTVNGLGLAVIRDFNSFLRNTSADDFGNSNPLANSIHRIYTYTLSQPARTLNDFVHLGFNEDEHHRKVFDGMLQWVGAGDGLNMNYRWSQTKRTERNRQEELYLEGLYPFANVPTFDPISRTSDWRYKKCEQTHTCPLALEFYSANEYWVKAASLMSTDPTGRFDLPDHPLTRLYLLSSAQHASAGNPASKGVCQQFLDPLDPAPVERALWTDLDEWSTRGVPPPDSEVPTLHGHTLALPTRSSVGFPNIPGVTFTGLKTTRYRFNYGPQFYQTFIPTINPPAGGAPYEDNPANGPIYPSYVPKTDSDGNDIAGIRLPELEVPLATYTGWALRAGAQANDGCEGSGQYIPFQATQQARVAVGDPRPSVQERYASYAVYEHQVVSAVDDLVRRRFFTCDDTQNIVTRLLTAGVAAGVPPAPANASQPNPVPACIGRMPPHHDHHDGDRD